MRGRQEAGRQAGRQGRRREARREGGREEGKLMLDNPELSPVLLTRYECI